MFYVKYISIFTNEHDYSPIKLYLKKTTKLNSVLLNLSLLQYSVLINSNTIHPVIHAKDLGVSLDASLIFDLTKFH